MLMTVNYDCIDYICLKDIINIAICVATVLPLLCLKLKLSRIHICIMSSLCVTKEHIAPLSAVGHCKYLGNPSV